MTLIKHEDAIRIKNLRNAGFSYSKCAEQLNISKGTIAKHCQKIALLNLLPPVLKVYNGKIQGRNQLKIKQNIRYNPKSTLTDILQDCELNCSISTLWEYLKRFGIPTQKAKLLIVVSDVNKQKRVDFCRLMLEKDDAYIISIIFSDETIVKSRPNGEVVFFHVPPGSDYFEPSNASGGKSVMFS
jgi:transposase